MPEAAGSRYAQDVGFANRSVSTERRFVSGATWRPSHQPGTWTMSCACASTPWRSPSVRPSGSSGRGQIIRTLSCSTSSRVVHSLQHSRRHHCRWARRWRRSRHHRRPPPPPPRSWCPGFKVCLSLVKNRYSCQGIPNPRVGDPYRIMQGLLHIISYHSCLSVPPRFAR